jgi:hypothetical protein
VDTLRDEESSLTGRDDSGGFFMIVLGLVGTSGAGGDLIPG